MSQTRSGYRRSASGLVGAVLACLALIGTIWLLAEFQGAGGEDVDPAPTIEYDEALAQARAEAPFAVLAPSPVPDGMRATSVNWEVAGPVSTWELGFLTAEDEFVGLEQSNAVTSEVVAAATPADQPAAGAEIAGQQWQGLSSDAGETAFVRVVDETTTVVTGTAPRDEIVAFIESLSAG